MEGSISPKYKVLSGSSLKLIALIAMIIDHAAYHILDNMAFAITPLFSIGSTSVTIYWICRKIGRIAFPIYAFLISEGYLHTHDKRKYGLSLLVFAFISEIPWNLEHTGDILLPSSQNVFFTLFLGFLAIYFCENWMADRDVKDLVLLTGIFAISYFLKADYGIRGVGFILLVHVLRGIRPAQALIGCSIFTNNAPAILGAFLLINGYNGKRGFINTSFEKYLFYAAYPLHILAIWLIKKNMLGW